MTSHILLDLPKLRTLSTFKVEHVCFHVVGKHLRQKRPGSPIPKYLAFACPPITSPDDYFFPVSVGSSNTVAAHERQVATSVIELYLENNTRYDVLEATLAAPEYLLAVEAKVRAPGTALVVRPMVKSRSQIEELQIETFNAMTCEDFMVCIASLVSSTATAPLPVVMAVQRAAQSHWANHCAVFVRTGTWASRNTNTDSALMGSIRDAWNDTVKLLASEQVDQAFLDYFDSM